jgi:hypothetical protein
MKTKCRNSSQAKGNNADRHLQKSISSPDRDRALVPHAASTCPQSSQKHRGCPPPSMNGPPERLSLRGPAATERRLLDMRAGCKKAMAATTKERERTQLNKIIDALNRGLRRLRKKRALPAIYYDFDALSDRERVMARLAKKFGQGRSVIFHGSRRLVDVLRSGKLMPPLDSECAVFFSRSAEVAAYFAGFLGDKEDQLSPGILVLDRDSLARSYRIGPNRYDVFSDRNEREEAIWYRIVNFRRHLLGVVREVDVTAILGPPKQRYLPRDFMHSTQAQRDAFHNRRMSRGNNFVRTGRARVRDIIIRE